MGFHCGVKNQKTNYTKVVSAFSNTCTSPATVSVISQVFHTIRINLSPFTKDFRVWGTLIESYPISLWVFLVKTSLSLDLQVLSRTYAQQSHRTSLWANYETYNWDHLKERRRSTSKELELKYKGNSNLLKQFKGISIVFLQIVRMNKWTR